MPINVLDRYTCPLTQLIMRDPIVASDGHHYEREAIENYERCSPQQFISPTTNLPIARHFFIDTDLKAEIDEFLQADRARWFASADSENVYLPRGFWIQLQRAIHQDDLQMFKAIVAKDPRLLTQVADDWHYAQLLQDGGLKTYALAKKYRAQSIIALIKPAKRKRHHKPALARLPEANFAPPGGMPFALSPRRQDLHDAPLADPALDVAAVNPIMRSLMRIPQVMLKIAISIKFTNRAILVLAALGIGAGIMFQRRENNLTLARSALPNTLTASTDSPMMPTVSSTRHIRSYTHLQDELLKQQPVKVGLLFPLLEQISAMTGPIDCITHVMSTLPNTNLLAEITNALESKLTPVNQLYFHVLLSRYYLQEKAYNEVITSLSIVTKLLTRVKPEAILSEQHLAEYENLYHAERQEAHMALGLQQEEDIANFYAKMGNYPDNLLARREAIQKHYQMALTSTNCLINNNVLINYYMLALIHHKCFTLTQLTRNPPHARAVLNILDAYAAFQKYTAHKITDSEKKLQSTPSPETVITLRENIAHHFQANQHRFTIILNNYLPKYHPQKRHHYLDIYSAITRDFSAPLTASVRIKP